MHSRTTNVPGTSKMNLMDRRLFLARVAVAGGTAVRCRVWILR